MKTGDTFKIKSSWNSAEEKGKTKEELFDIRKRKDILEHMVIPFIAYQNDVRCSVVFQPNVVHTLKGTIYESKLRFLESKRIFDKKYNPTFFQKHFPTFEGYLYNLKNLFGKL